MCVFSAQLPSLRPQDTEKHAVLSPPRAELPEYLQAPGESPQCSFSFSVVVVSVRGGDLCAVVVKAAFLFSVSMWMMFAVCF